MGYKIRSKGRLMNTLKLLTDQAVGEENCHKQDGLGFESYAKVLGDAALGVQGQFTIGIFGKWGEGKTSLMRLVKRYIENNSNDDISTVWCDAWMFDQEEHPVFANNCNNFK